ncbi:hypothetical protein [Nocardiopsis sp. CC223A]|uniref:hypothetical protein n=1 Tax=Nocardiopsis sp. CC223A TaxID=3044051 RepID=UPI00278C01E5|nr:hypothetical protein [Nocardiopsis sp. CC223A]
MRAAGGQAAAGYPGVPGMLSERGAAGGAGDAASAFLAGRGADSFTSLYAAPGGYEQRLAAVKPVPTSVWKRTVFTVTGGRVNPG